MGLVNFTEATLLMKTQSQQISQWVCGEASTAEHASHTHLFNQYFLAQKASEMKGENFRVVMLSLTRKPSHRGIIKQRGTQAACDCVLNSERFVIPREGQKLPFHVLQWGRGQEKTQALQYLLYAKVLGFGVRCQTLWDLYSQCCAPARCFGWPVLVAGHLIPGDYVNNVNLELGGGASHQLTRISHREVGNRNTNREDMKEGEGRDLEILWAL